MINVDWLLIDPFHCTIPYKTQHNTHHNTQHNIIHNTKRYSLQHNTTQRNLTTAHDANDNRAELWTPPDRGPVRLCKWSGTRWRTRGRCLCLRAGCLRMWFCFLSFSRLLVLALAYTLFYAFLIFWSFFWKLGYVWRMVGYYSAYLTYYLTNYLPTYPPNQLPNGRLRLTEPNRIELNWTNI